MTNICAAIGYAQTLRFNELVQRHIDNAHRYQEGLKGLVGISVAQEAPWAKNVYWMFGIEIKPEFGMSRDELRAFLANKGVETRTYFVPIHLQPFYYRGRMFFPNSERLSKEGMYLPSSSKLTKEQQQRVIDTIREAYHV
jgi:perosamine synthetase